MPPSTAGRNSFHFLFVRQRSPRLFWSFTSCSLSNPSTTSSCVSVFCSKRRRFLPQELAKELFFGFGWLAYLDVWAYLSSRSFHSAPDWLEDSFAVHPICMFRLWPCFPSVPRIRAID
ncbi:hypothetical protein B0H12DRAFT_1101796 [Mycena haematopus]|nr:hypothetical protein B0H12DRAFT_1101796 [Mycena haematopus]